MEAYERLLKYIAIDTQSEDDAAATPSTEKQFDLSRILAAEMEGMGMERVRVDEHAYVYGFISASEGYENVPAVGLIAHVDTAPDFSGSNVKPRIIENYGGADVALGSSGLVLETEKFPDLKDSVGKTLIVTDGTTLLGADDKAGVAEILTACERIINDGLPHCAVSVCFAPDEEIGHGAELLNIEQFGADFAYTIDGDAINEINYETFNAASAVFDVFGVNVHPGSAKDIMKNACLIAMEINSMLPENEIPARTENYQGFFHMTDMSGTVDTAQLKYIVRDHDAEKFASRCNFLCEVEKRVNEKYGAGTVSLKLKNQYRNMAEILAGRMEIVHRAERALRKQGIEPVYVPVRGGTDGSQLTFRGLPCPNLGTGGFGFHGPYEHITAEAMNEMVDIILNILADKE